jgi:hypothetical protein
MWAALRDGFAAADVEVGLIIDTVRDLGVGSESRARSPSSRRPTPRSSDWG